MAVPRASHLHVKPPLTYPPPHGPSYTGASQVFLRFPRCLAANCFVTALHWLVWGWQFARSVAAVERVCIPACGARTPG